MANPNPFYGIEEAKTNYSGPIFTIKDEVDDLVYIGVKNGHVMELYSHKMLEGEGTLEILPGKQVHYQHMESDDKTPRLIGENVFYLGEAVLTEDGGLALKLAEQDRYQGARDEFRDELATVLRGRKDFGYMIPKFASSYDKNPAIVPSSVQADAQSKGLEYLIDRKTA